MEAVGAGGHQADGLAAGVDTVGCVHVGVVGFHGQIGEPPPVGLLTRGRPGPAGQQRVAAHEVALVDLHEPMQPGLVRVHVVSELAAGEIALLHAQRVQRMVARVGHPQRLARSPQRVVDGAEILDRHMELPAEFAGEPHPQRPHVRHAGHRDDLRPQPSEVLVAQIGVGEAGKQSPGLGPGDVQHPELHRPGHQLSVGAAGPVRLEELPILALAGSGRHQVEMVGGQPGDGQLALDASLRRQQVRQADASHRGHGVGGQAVEHRRRVGSDQVELGEGGGVEDPDPLPHGPALLGHYVEPAGVAERDHVVARQPGRGREPLGPLPAVDLGEHRALAVQAPIEGGGAIGTPGRPLKCGQGCLVAVLVVLGPLRPAVGHDVGAVDVAEPAGVVGPNAHAGGAVHHPAGQLPAQARPVGDAHLHAHHLPEVGHPRRAQQGLAVGRVRDGAADDLLDAQRLQHRHALEGPGQPQADPVEIRVEQGVLQRPVRSVAVVPDGLGAGLLVDPDQA